MAIIPCLLLAACGGGDPQDDGRDESKLSATLEQRAHAIESRANDAVAAVERDADADLARLNEEANTAAVNNDTSAAAASASNRQNDPRSSSSAQ